MASVAQSGNALAQRMNPGVSHQCVRSEIKTSFCWFSLCLYVGIRFSIVWNRLALGIEETIGDGNCDLVFTTDEQHSALHDFMIWAYIDCWNMVSWHRLELSSHRFIDTFHLFSLSFWQSLHIYRSGNRFAAVVNANRLIRTVMNSLARSWIDGTTMAVSSFQRMIKNSRLNVVLNNLSIIWGRRNDP